MNKKRIIIAVVVGLAVGVCVGWAGATVLREPREATQQSTYTTIAAAEGEVANELAVTGLALWKSIPVGMNQAAGTVTRIHVKRGQEVTMGTALYSVNEKPVVIAQGDIPAFRDLAQGDKGVDVKQLTKLLVAKGFLNSESSRFTFAVKGAVKAWQKSLGQPQTGVVGRGDIVFSPKLPLKIVLDPKLIKVGADVSASQPAISRLSDAPIFKIMAPDAVSDLLATGMTVKMTHKKHEWQGQLGQLELNQETRQMEATVVRADKSPICGKDCAGIPFQGTTRVKAIAVLQAPVKGVLVPTGAIVTSADQKTVVVLEDGDQVPITILGRGKGMAAVNGISSGQRIRIPNK